VIFSLTRVVFAVHYRSLLQRDQQY